MPPTPKPGVKMCTKLGGEFSMSDGTLEESSVEVMVRAWEESEEENSVEVMVRMRRVRRRVQRIGGRWAHTISS